MEGPVSRRTPQTNEHLSAHGRGCISSSRENGFEMGGVLSLLKQAPRISHRATFSSSVCMRRCGRGGGLIPARCPGVMFIHFAVSHLFIFLSSVTAFPEVQSSRGVSARLPGLRRRPEELNTPSPAFRPNAFHSTRLETRQQLWSVCVVVEIVPPPSFHPPPPLPPPRFNAPLRVSNSMLN